MNIQEKNSLRIKLDAAPVNYGESFPEGVIFKKAEYAYKFDKEAKKSTDEKEAIQITATDKATLEDFKVKLPLDTKVPENLKPFTEVEFGQMTGVRVGFDTFLRAQAVKVKQS